MAFVGIILAVYLLWERYFRPSFQPCNINSVVNCQAIISGKVSDTFGIPTPLIGLIGYVAILLGAFLKKAKTVAFFATFGFLFCLWIGYQELAILHVICPVCILCQVDMLTTWILSLVILRRSLI